SSIFADQTGSEGTDSVAFEARLANWYIESERLGRLTLGRQSSATDGITTIDLTRAKTDPVVWHNKSFGIRSSGCDYTGLTWGNVAWGLEGERGDLIRYDTPMFYGFIVSAGWGENDNWDAAFRFYKDLNSVRVGRRVVGYRLGRRRLECQRLSEPDRGDERLDLRAAPADRPLRQCRGGFGQSFARGAGRPRQSRRRRDVDGAGGRREARFHLWRNDALRRIWRIFRPAVRLFKLRAGRRAVNRGGQHRRHGRLAVGRRGRAAIRRGCHGGLHRVQPFRCGNPHRFERHGANRAMVRRRRRLAAEILGSDRRLMGGARENRARPSYS
ncbi:MAG: porin, partial [Rhodomicrobium sp.]|nr:porin [Rhodomicrobium sp.]